MARERADSRSTRLRAGRSAIRLRHHAGSIDEATIEQFKPIWNLVIYGVGNKDPGKRRATQFRSPWDVLHPGRQFPEKLADGGTTAEMPITRLRAYFAGQFVPLVPADEAGDIGTTEDEEE